MVEGVTQTARARLGADGGSPRPPPPPLKGRGRFAPRRLTQHPKSKFELLAAPMLHALWPRQTRRARDGLRSTPPAPRALPRRATLRAHPTTTLAAVRAPAATAPAAAPAPGSARAPASPPASEASSFITAFSIRDKRMMPGRDAYGNAWKGTRIRSWLTTVRLCAIGNCAGDRHNHTLLYADGVRRLTLLFSG